MDLVSIIGLIVVAGFILFYALAFSLYLWERLDDIRAYYRDKRQAKRLARARSKSEGEARAVEDVSGVVTHDAVLSFLSQSVVSDFRSLSTQDAPRLISPYSKSEPAGSLTTSSSSGAFEGSALDNKIVRS